MHSVTWVVVDDHGGGTVVDGLPSPDHVVAADSGVSLALRLGLAVDLVVGDLDSAPAEDLATAVAAGAVLEEHPATKDATDLELALLAAAAATAEDGLLVVVGGAGGRLDHALANVGALGDPALGPRRVRARLGGADVHVVRDRAVLDLLIGTTVSLLPVGGPATGITTENLRYPLTDGRLAPWTTRGVSNVAAASPVTVSLDDGCLLVVVPPIPKDDR